MSPVSVRYIVQDIGEAIGFYTQRLGFEVEMHPAPGFAGRRHSRAGLPQSDC